MEIKQVKPNIFFVDAPGASSNNVFLKTSAGVVMIDTTTSQEEMQAVLDLAGLTPEDITLVINTHADGDHVLGNGLFDCPILAHQSTYDRMKEAGRPADEMPSETFTGERHSLRYGEFQIELIFTGGHKKDMTMVWLPEQKVLFASDIIFEGRYPYMLQSIVPTWIEVLKTLASYHADVYLPGHGTVCTQADVDLLVDYMETTWKRVNELVGDGVPLEEILKDPGLPKVDHWIRENFFEKNIEYMVEVIG